MRTKLSVCVAVILSMLGFSTSHAWVTTTVDSIGSVGLYTSIALDSSDRVHISYIDWTDEDLKYATNSTGTWVTTTVDSIGPVGLYTSIALDSLGKVHISYVDWTDEDLKYATNESGSWVTTTLDSIGSVGLYTSIALDSSDKAHISYYDATNDDLKHATNASGDWVTETLDADGDVGWDTSIALDSLGKVHISYYDVTNGDLKHATNASGSWATGAVDTTGQVGMYSSIALDSSDKVHIGYSDRTRRDLKYANNACIDNDGDGYGDPGHQACPGGPEVDCDDTEPRVNPGAYEACDGLDNDCDGNVPPEEVDKDEDGYMICHNDCDDNNPDVNPGVTEGPFRDPSCSDMVDNDCDGDMDGKDRACLECIDNDRDGYGQPASENCSHAQADCDDTEPNVNPGMAENCSNGIDDDCDTNIDDADSDCGGGGCLLTSAAASVYDTDSAQTSSFLEYLPYALLPFGLVLLWIGVRRKNRRTAL